MINRLAVMLVGQYRTFAVTHRYLFEFFETKAHHVDYYFITWAVTGGHNTRYYEEPVAITKDDITKYFADEKLVDYQIVDDIPKKHTYYRMAYLSKIGIRLKREEECRNHFIYDQVVETRPDIYLRQDLNLEWPVCGPLEYGGHRVETINGHLFMDDCYIRTDSATHNIVADRISKFDREEMYRPRLAFADQYEYDHHSRYADWLVTHNIKRIEITDYAFINVVRDPRLAGVDLNSMSSDEINGSSYEYTETRPRPKFISVYHNTLITEFTATNNIFIEANGKSLIDSLRYAALRIDQICYFNNEKYDWVRFIQNDKDHPDNFFKRLPYARLDTVYISDDPLSECNFYCHPDLFSLIGNVYKIRKQHPERTDEVNLMDLFVKCDIRVERIC
jgi:hypothetical protein